MASNLEMAKVAIDGIRKEVLKPFSLTSDTRLRHLRGGLYAIYQEMEPEELEEIEAYNQASY